MNKKSIIKFVALLLVCCAMLGCSKQPTRVYGFVVDSFTGNPVPNAFVKLISYGVDYASCVSGSDGYYDMVFDNVGGEIEIYVDIDHYHIYRHKINIITGEDNKYDILLKHY